MLDQGPVCASLQRPAGSSASVLGGACSGALQSEPIEPLVIAEGAWPAPGIVMNISISVDMPDGAAVAAAQEDALQASIASALAAAVQCGSTGSAASWLLMSRPVVALRRSAASGLLHAMIVVNVTALRPFGANASAGLHAGELFCRSPAAMLIVPAGSSAASSAAAKACRTTEQLQLLERSPVTVWPALWPLPSSWALVPTSRTSTGTPKPWPCVNRGGSPACADVTADHWNATIGTAQRVNVELASAAGAVISEETVAVIQLPREHGAARVQARLVRGNQTSGLSFSPPTTHLTVPVIRHVAASGTAHAALLLPTFEAVCGDSAVAGSSTSQLTAAPTQLRRGRPPCKPPTLLLSSSEATAGNASASDAADLLQSVCAAAAAVASSPDVSLLDAAALSVPLRPMTVSCPPLCSAWQLPVPPRHGNASAAARCLQATTSATSNTASAATFDSLAALAATGAFSSGNSSGGSANMSAASAAAARRLVAGLRYVRKCHVGGSLSAIQAQEMCSNASNPLSAGDAGICTWGEAEDCVPCPPGGLCPGGYRLWSAPGWWVRSEDSLLYPVQCSYPAAARCVGWDSAAGTTACGTGYAAGSYACGKCAAGYYASADDGGACMPCPGTASSSSTAQAVLAAAGVIVGGLATVFLVIAAISFALARKSGTSARRSLHRSVSISIASVIILQAAAAAARSAPPGAPAAIAWMFAGLQLLQLQGVAPVPLGCSASGSASAFAVSEALLALMLAVTLLWLASWAAWFRWAKATAASTSAPQPQALTARSLSLGLATGRSSADAASTAASRTMPRWLAVFVSCGSVALVVVVLLFSLAADTVADLLACRSQTVSLADYQTLLGADGTTAAAALAGAGVARLSPAEALMSSDPALLSFTFRVGLLSAFQSRVCGESGHAAARGLAIATVVLVLALLPIATAVVLRLTVRSVLASTRVPAALLAARLPHIAYGAASTDEALAEARSAFTAVLAARQAAETASELGLRLKSRADGPDNPAGKAAFGAEVKLPLSDLTEAQLQRMLASQVLARRSAFVSAQGASALRSRNAVPQTMLACVRRCFWPCCGLVNPDRAADAVGAADQSATGSGSLRGVAGALSTASFKRPGAAASPTPSLSPSLSASLGAFLGGVLPLGNSRLPQSSDRAAGAAATAGAPVKAKAGGVAASSRALAGLQSMASPQLQAVKLKAQQQQGKRRLRQSSTPMLMLVPDGSSASVDPSAGGSDGSPAASTPRPGLASEAFASDPGAVTVDSPAVTVDSPRSPSARSAGAGSSGPTSPRTVHLSLVPSAAGDAGPKPGSVGGRSRPSALPPKQLPQPIRVPLCGCDYRGAAPCVRRFPFEARAASDVADSNEALRLHTPALSLLTGWEQARVSASLPFFQLHMGLLITIAAARCIGDAVPAARVGMTAASVVACLSFAGWQLVAWPDPPHLQLRLPARVLALLLAAAIQIYGCVAAQRQASSPTATSVSSSEAAWAVIVAILAYSLAPALLLTLVGAGSAGARRDAAALSKATEAAAAAAACVKASVTGDRLALLASGSASAIVAAVVQQAGPVNPAGLVLAGNPLRSPSGKTALGAALRKSSSREALGSGRSTATVGDTADTGGAGLLPLSPALHPLSFAAGERSPSLRSPTAKTMPLLSDLEMRSSSSKAAASAALEAAGAVAAVARSGSGSKAKRLTSFSPSSQHIRPSTGSGGRSSRSGSAKEDRDDDRGDAVLEASEAAAGAASSADDGTGAAADSDAGAAARDSTFNPLRKNLALGASSRRHRDKPTLRDRDFGGSNRRSWTVTMTGKPQTAEHAHKPGRLVRAPPGAHAVENALGRAVHIATTE